MKLQNEYARLLGNLFADTPKAVFAAIAVSYATGGGDWLDKASENVLREWWVLYDNQIIPQRPRLPRPPEGETMQ
jgi:hypothetical protein